MNVRCKFLVTGINHLHIYTPPDQPSKPCAEVRMTPVWEHDGPNLQWSEATPTGEIKMMITNPSAIGAFELGKCYFVDFSPSD